MGKAQGTGSGPGATGRGRSGPVRSAVDRRLRDLTGKRTIDQAVAALSIEQLVPALLAQRYATAVDRATKAEDDARLVAAGEKLRAVLASLEPTKAPEGGAGDDRSSGSDGGAQLLSILDRAPTVGDTAHA